MINFQEYRQGEIEIGCKKCHFFLKNFSAVKIELPMCC